MKVLGIDPGSTVGYAVMTDQGISKWGQGPMLDVIPEIISTAMAHAQLDVIAIERAFVGRGIHSSLVVAENESFLRGALWQAGVRANNWRPLAMEWRALHGFRRESKLAHQQALGMAAARTGSQFRPKNIHVAEAICIAIAAWEKTSNERNQLTLGGM
jgi:Holliday junction resolvasome RuvABC endonuclease subunit